MKNLALLLLTMILLHACESFDQKVVPDPLPSWNDGPVKQAIVEFVTVTTNPDGKYFIPEADRIAVFDNDGTLWSERPMYFPFEFAFDMVRFHASEHPEWNEKQPFKGILEHDSQAVFASGEEGILDLLVETHTGMTNADFKQMVDNWIDTARHDVTGWLYKDMVYQPMIELLDYFRAHQFRTFIVSGGPIAFMQPWSEEVYGIPTEQLIGSRFKLVYEYTDEGPVVFRAPEFEFLNDKGGKVESISYQIGKRPVAAFGNSDGDLAMLQYTSAGEGRRLMVYIHHTDGEREYAYDRESPVGRLDKGLDEAKSKKWIVVDMKNDWKKIYPKYN